MKDKDSMTAELRKSDIRAVPDPEVPEKAVRRKFTAHLFEAGETPATCCVA